MSSICVQLSKDLRVQLDAYSDQDFDDLATILYPVWRKDITDEQIIAYFKERGIELYQGKYYEYVIPQIRKLCLRIQRKQPLLVESAKIEREKRLLLEKERKQKFSTMLFLSVFFYFIFFILSSFDDYSTRDAWIGSVVLWFLWATIELSIFFLWDVKSSFSKITRLFIIFSFLSVPIFGILSLLIFQTYKDHSLLRRTMLLFAPSGYFITWGVLLSWYILKILLGLLIWSWTSTVTIVKRIRDSWKHISNLQKIFVWLSLAACGLLTAAICDGDFDGGFFVFLRIITCGAFVGLILQKIPLWLKFVFILGAVLYNPIVMIHLGDRDIWALYNAISIPALLVPWICLLSKRGDFDNGTSEER